MLIHKHVNPKLHDHVAVKYFRHTCCAVQPTVTGLCLSCCDKIVFMYRGQLITDDCKNTGIYSAICKYLRL